MTVGDAYWLRWLMDMLTPPVFLILGLLLLGSLRRLRKAIERKP
jgi:hypothetical protein